jgi:PKD repeat protein
MFRPVRRLAAAVLLGVALIVVPASVAAAPAVTFTGPATAEPGQTVTFTAGDGVCPESRTCSWTVTTGGVTEPAGGGPTLTSAFAAGSYLIGLDVTGPTADDVGHAEAALLVTAPPPQNEPPTVSFTSSVSGRTATFSAVASDPEGGPVDLTWSFGDGQSATGPMPTHTYTVADTYTVTVTARDADGATGTDSHAVTVTDPPPPADQPPTISFTSTTSGLSASFAAVASDPEGKLTGVTWDFGDGKTGTGLRPSHTYAQGGTYTVEATAKDAAGQTATDTGTVTVAAPPAPANHAPTISFAYLTSGLSASFAATAGDVDGDPVTVTWQFGDGSAAATGAQVTHDFAKAGTYTVTVTARDSKGATGTAQASVTVVDPPAGQPQATAPTPDPPATSTTPPAAGTPATGFSTTSTSTGVPTTAAPTVPPGMRRMSPFPVIRVAGRFVGRATLLTVVSVRAGRTARILVRCTGRGCPYAARTYRRSRLSSGRVRTLEGRRLQPGARLELRVLQPGRIGKRTVLRFADRKAPRRTDGCVTPAGKPVRCPA